MREVAALAVAISLAGCASIGGSDHSGGDDGSAADAAPGDDRSADTPDAAGPVTRAVTVPGTVVWTDTGIDLAAGDHAHVAASGLVAHGGGGEYGPDGDPALSNFAANIVNCVGHVSLIGRVGTAGDPFFVGDANTFAATVTDRLFLGVNDIGVDNNAGSFSADVTTGLSPSAVAGGPVTVPGTVAWTDTGVDLATGQQLTITASGAVIHDSATGNDCDPTGEPGTSNHGASLIACPNHASLLAKIGDGGAPFYVGRLLSIPAPAAGRLYLGINDNDLSNNGGQYDAAVTVTQL